MASKKNQKSAKETKATRGHAYELTDKGKKLTDLKGQQEIIVGQLRKGAQTAHDVAAAVGKKLETRQEPVAVVRFYLTSYKKDGIVRFAKEAKTPKAAKRTRKAKAEEPAVESPTTNAA